MIRETWVIDAFGNPDHVRRAVTFALVQEGFHVARQEPGYVEARRGKPSPLRAVTLMRIETTPVVVCVSIEPTDADGATVKVGAYPDLGPAVIMGPIARHKWRSAMQAAVRIVCEAALDPRRSHRAPRSEPPGQPRHAVVVPG